MGTLYVVPTPIGNLEDITLRALRILRDVSLIAAEDTRTTGFLLQHYKIDTPLLSYHEHNKLTRLDTVMDALSKGDVALVSDAGTPGISDPGYELIGAALAQGIRIEPLPGASALLPALVASGLPTDAFIYMGFLPRKAKARADVLLSLKNEGRTVIFYESPNRLLDTLADIEQILGDRPLCVARELSKLYEEFARGSATALLTHYGEHPPRGEIVLLIGGAKTDNLRWDEAQVRAALLVQINQGEPLSRAARTVATQSGWNRRDVYALGTGN